MINELIFLFFGSEKIIKIPFSHENSSPHPAESLLSSSLRFAIVVNYFFAVPCARRKRTVCFLTRDHGNTKKNCSVYKVIFGELSKGRWNPNIKEELRNKNCQTRAKGSSELIHSKKYFRVIETFQMVSAEANRLHFIVFVEKENIRGI
jgi:hypothetical protein